MELVFCRLFFSTCFFINFLILDYILAHKALFKVWAWPKNICLCMRKWLSWKILVYILELHHVVYLLFAAYPQSSWNIWVLVKGLSQIWLLDILNDLFILKCFYIFEVNTWRLIIKLYNMHCEKERGGRKKKQRYRVCVRKLKISYCTLYR